MRESQLRMKLLQNIPKMPNKRSFTNAGTLSKISSKLGLRSGTSLQHCFISWIHSRGAWSGATVGRHIGGGFFTLRMISEENTHLPPSGSSSNRAAELLALPLALTIRRKSQHAIWRPSDHHLLKDDRKTVHVSFRSAFARACDVSQELWSRPEEIWVGKRGRICQSLLYRLLPGLWLWQAVMSCDDTGHGGKIVVYLQVEILPEEPSETPGAH